MSKSPLKTASLVLATAGLVTSLSAGAALAESVLGDRSRSWFPKSYDSKVISEKPGQVQSGQNATQQRQNQGGRPASQTGTKAR